MSTISKRDEKNIWNKTVRINWFPRKLSRVAFIYYGTVEFGTQMFKLFYSVFETFVKMSNTDNDQLNPASTSTRADSRYVYVTNKCLSSGSRGNAHASSSTDHGGMALQEPTGLKRKYCPICDDSSDDEDSSDNDGRWKHNKIVCNFFFFRFYCDLTIPLSFI